MEVAGHKPIDILLLLNKQSQGFINKQEITN